MTPSPRRLASLTGLVLILAACGADPDAPSQGGGDAREVREYEAGPVPEGSGGDAADDVNGDGFTDLLFVTDYDAEQLNADPPAAPDEFRRLMVVYGSADGLDPATRTVLPPRAVLAVSASGHGGPRRPGTADLDGDGFSDIPVRTDSGDDRPGGQAVVWGGPAGPDPDAAPTLLTAPSGQAWESSYRPPAAGDFDGDGNADLVLSQEAMPVTGESVLRVLYGPFDRDGTPARTAERALTGRVGALVPEPLPAEGGPTRLLVRRGDDGEQPGNTLLLTGPGDPAEWDEVDLRPGALAAFADLDGDGESDLALADDGSRNNEPGFGTEAPEVDRRVNVYPGPVTAQAQEQGPVAGDLPRADSTGSSSPVSGMAACDTDGDGRDELAIGTHGLGVDLMRVAGDTVEVDPGERLVRRGPDSGPIGAENDPARTARVYSCADYDADGSDELVLVYGPGPYGTSPARWWVTDGAEDESSFDSAAFTD
ncbi:hypothetical protein DFP74_6178 [Nocardiopsis sp. Huas11]|uniref:FG-GAP repeat domain-containing protein n=1 Tax=Nocardiopsis sp. Huas11 TaxID=2183912 RepID=UPI000EB4101A|nr:VCBS repeat-containing protein [Nocardiopsis sp. Huas11]RKS10412.1 hypothetical protein DFP74_6178 [Nocardiopsis sp. Huas11]